MEIDMKGICKSFGTNQVLRGVNLHLHSGEVQALMGKTAPGNPR